MVLMTVLTAAAMTTINYIIRDDDAKTEGRRIAALIRLASEEALLTGRELGLRIDAEQLRFYVFEDETGRWLVLDADDTFRPRPIPEHLDLDLVLEGQAVQLAAAASAPEGEDDVMYTAPQLMFLSSGEATPFTLTIREPGAESWVLEGDLLGRVSLEALP